MIARTHRDGERESTVLLSECGAFRYLLGRRWGQGPLLLAVLLNPSTADEHRDDATVARLVARARTAGFGGLDLANLYAFRATRPADLWRAGAPPGPRNADVLVRAAGRADTVLCGWGDHGLRGGRAEAVLGLLRGRRLAHLGLTRRGAPRHPLYVPAARRLEAWDG